MGRSHLRLVRCCALLPAVLVAATLAALPVSGQSTTSTADRDTPQHLLSVHYDSAFAALVATIDSTDTELAPLLSLARFKALHVAWAVERQGAIYALVPSRARAWLVAVPREDPAFARMGSILERDGGASVPAVRIKTEFISSRWAAIFLTFELSGLADDVLDIMPAAPTDADHLAASLRAYELEYLATLAFGGAGYAVALDTLLSNARPATARQLAEQLPVLLRQHFPTLDSHFGGVDALTEREEQRRAGVFAMSLLLRFASRAQLTDEEIGAAMRCFGGCRESP